MGDTMLPPSLHKKILQQMRCIMMNNVTLQNDKLKSLWSCHPYKYALCAASFFFFIATEFLGVLFFLSFTVQRMDLFTSKRKNMTFERTALWDLDNLKGYSHLAFSLSGHSLWKMWEMESGLGMHTSLCSLLWEFQAHLLGTPRQVNGESYAFVGSSFHAASTDSDWKVKKPDGNPPLNLE